MSRMVRGYLERYQGVSRSRVDVIPNAIDAGRLAVDAPSLARGEFRTRLGLAPDDLVALFVGHNYALKGLAPLMRALAARERSSRPIHLVACGGNDVGPYRALAGRLGLAKTVHLAGFQQDIRPPFWASDFFVLPTYYDPCSLVVFEALACGLPVITTACNGAGELIARGPRGLRRPSSGRHCGSGRGTRPHDRRRGPRRDVGPRRSARA